MDIGFMKKILTVILTTTMVCAANSVFAMTTEEFDKNTQLGLKFYNSGMYYQAKTELQKFCDENWDALNEGQKTYIQGYLDDAKQKLEHKDENNNIQLLTTEEFDRGMAKGIEYFNKGLYHEAYDEFTWFRNSHYEDMNAGQQKYIDEYLYGAKVKREEVDPYWYNKEYDTMGWVYTGYDYSGSYLTYTGGYYVNGKFVKQARHEDYTFLIPKFNSKSQSIKHLNTTIYNNVYAGIKESIDGLKSSCSPWVIDSNYSATQYGNYVSVVVRQQLDYGFFDYYAYTINIATNSQTTNKELVERTGYSENDFLGILGNLMIEKFYENNALNRSNKYDNDNYYKQKSKTTTSEYCNINNPMYVGDNGHLMVWALVPSVAGADAYYRFIDTGLMVY